MLYDYKGNLIRTVPERCAADLLGKVTTEYISMLFKPITLGKMSQTQLFDEYGNAVSSVKLQQKVITIRRPNKFRLQ